MTVASNWEAVRARAVAASARAGRAPGAVRIVAISKTVAATTVAEALRAGVTDLGENRAQELQAKAAALDALALEEQARWHFVGHLQTNKVRLVVGLAALVHSVDRVEVVEAIGRRASAQGITQDVLVEVNVSGEPSKHGVDSGTAPDLCEASAAVAGVRVVGLMTMPPWPERPDDSRPYYKELGSLLHEVAARVPDARELSMGMSRDFEVAIEEGATIVRVGEAIFGARSA
jgi:pyridoxal phosphate enzyme (YggS family)